MQYSEKFGFFLPSRHVGDYADINQISYNFRLIDENVPKKNEVEEAIQANIDQFVDPTSPRAQSGKAVEQAIQSNIDQTYNHTSKNAQSGKAVEQAIQENIDQTYSPTSENAQSGIAVAQAIANIGSTEKKYELIETITVTEAVSSITRNTEPNGNAYSFKDVYVRFTWGDSVGSSKWVKVAVTANGKSANAFRVYNATGKNAVSWIKTLCHYGQRLFVLSGATTNIAYADFYAYIPVSTLETDAPIGSITISHEVGFPAETKIEIYGVRV